ncbi:MAG: hypothetical protein ACXWYT_12025 [Actinomycetota bacterium]
MRGNVDHSEFRDFVFALLFFKRISDVHPGADDPDGSAWGRGTCPVRHDRHDLFRRWGRATPMGEPRMT